MTEISTHYSYLYSILKDISSDVDLSSLLLFKGGTSLMFFYDLPRFSVDLDFTLIDKEKGQFVFDSLLNLAKKYGKIVESNLGLFGPKVILSYGRSSWNLKIEVSNRYWNERSDILTLDGFSLNVMSLPDMYAHKLIALEERTGVATRDIFDIWFFERLEVSPNEEIIKQRKGRTLIEQLTLDLSVLETFPNNRILSSLAPLLTPDNVKWARTHLLPEVISLLRRRQSAEKIKLRFSEQGSLPAPKVKKGIKW